ncbi:MAG: DUF393 domain-containing protein [Verrucomicrobiota bacterium]
MNQLTIFYDPRCGICSRFREWLEQQALWVRMEFVDYRSEEAVVRFPDIGAVKADKECVVLADDGRWWQGADAWILCLWATREYRLWSNRLAGPMFKPVLTNVVHLISSNRLTLSRLMKLKSDHDLASELAHHRPECEGDHCPAIPALQQVKPYNAWK